VRLTVERLGHLGDGIAEGGILVSQALPGEVVEGEVVGRRLEGVRIVEPSPDRVRAPCPHYRTCGGCVLMHARDTWVADWKVDVARRALAAQCLAADFRPIATSPVASRRRATLAGRRTRSGAFVGFHGRSSAALVDLRECRLLRPEIVALLPTLRELTAMAATRTSEVTLSVTVTLGGAEIAVDGALPLDPPATARLAAMAAAAGIARIGWNGEVAVQLAVPLQEFGGTRVSPPLGAFLQATAEGERALAASVAEATAGARRVADLFAGCGTFALRLATTAAGVHAVEGSREMLAALDAGWRLSRGLCRVTTECRDLFARPLAGAELARFDAVVIDPPRAGAEAQSRALAESHLATLAYVSCNPVSFARDARILTDGGFRLDWVQVVDQFRWSPHVELVGAFRR